MFTTYLVLTSCVVLVATFVFGMNFQKLQARRQPPAEALPVSPLQPNETRQEGEAPRVHVVGLSTMPEEVDDHIHWMAPEWKGIKLPIEVSDFYHAEPHVQMAIDAYVGTYSANMIGMSDRTWPATSDVFYRQLRLGRPVMVCKEFCSFMRGRYDRYLICLIDPRQGLGPRLPRAMTERLNANGYQFFAKLETTIEKDITPFLRQRGRGQIPPGAPDDQELRRRITRCMEPWRR